MPDDPSRAPRVPRQGVTIPGVENGQKWVVSARPHPSPAQVASIPGPWPGRHGLSSLPVEDKSVTTWWWWRVGDYSFAQIPHRNITQRSSAVCVSWLRLGGGQPGKISANLQSCKQPGPLLATPSPTPLTLKPWFRRYWASNTSVGLHKAVSQMLTSFLPD